MFTTGHDAEQLIARQKDLLDNATPVGQLAWPPSPSLRLGALTGERPLPEPADDPPAARRRSPAQHPTAFAHLLAAVDLSAAAASTRSS